MNDELQRLEQQVESAAEAMQAAKWHFKERSRVRFRDPFGSPERDTANYLFEQAERDYKEKVAAFQLVAKMYDDLKMLARKE
jgi:hypothetical protein